MERTSALIARYGAEALDVVQAVEAVEGEWSAGTITAHGRFPDETSLRAPGTLAEFHLGDADFNDMKVVDLVPNERFHWRCVTGAPEWIKTEVSFALRTDGGKTVILFAARCDGVRRRYDAAGLTFCLMRYYSCLGTHHVGACIEKDLAPPSSTRRMTAQEDALRPLTIACTRSVTNLLSLEEGRALPVDC